MKVQSGLPCILIFGTLLLLHVESCASLSAMFYIPLSPLPCTVPVSLHYRPSSLALFANQNQEMTTQARNQTTVTVTAGTQVAVNQNALSVYLLITNNTRSVHVRIFF